MTTWAYRLSFINVQGAIVSYGVTTPCFRQSTGVYVKQETIMFRLYLLPTHAAKTANYIRRSLWSR